MSKIIPRPFETEFGTVDPGEAVAFLSTHAGKPTFKRGIYRGVSAANNCRAVVEYDKIISGYRHVDNPEILSYRQLNTWLKSRKEAWKTADSKITYVRDYPVRVHSTLQLNRLIPARNKL